MNVFTISVPNEKEKCANWKWILRNFFLVDVLRSGPKVGVKNGIFWSEIVSEFGERGFTPPRKIPRSTPLRD